MNPSDLLVEHLPLLDNIIANVCRRGGMQPADVDEFAAEVKLRLIENDYAILRKFEARSSLGTYLSAVVHRLLYDYRIQRWGKWYSSAEAKRQGAAAIDLEQMLYRDGRSIEEALHVMQSRYPAMTRADVEALAARLPQRLRRARVISLEESAERTALPSQSSSSAAVDNADLGGRVSEIVCEFLDRLSADDQLALRLRFESEMTVAHIARALRQDQQVLYRRLRRLFDELRGSLEAAGISGRHVAEIIGSDSAMLDFRLANARPRNSDQSAHRIEGGDDQLIDAEISN
ncbi:MAG TPA: sigma-70 family RNA polymerase sigma factor [Thermoanaerobaculia bacterium]|jgi:RNA polymerase sigma factor for flagellar operon FliA